MPVPPNMNTHKDIFSITMDKEGQRKMRVHEFIVTTDFTREDLTQLSAESGRFLSDIRLEFAHGDGINLVDVKSLLGMLLLPIRSGTTVTLRVKGRDEEEAFSHMLDLLEKE